MHELHGPSGKMGDTHYTAQLKMTKNSNLTMLVHLCIAQHHHTDVRTYINLDLSMSPRQMMNMSIRMTSSGYQFKRRETRPMDSVSCGIQIQDRKRC